APVGLRAAGLRAAGHEGDDLRMVAMGEPAAERGARGARAADAVDDLHVDAGPAERRDLLARAAEHQRITALEAHHAVAGPRLADHERLDEALRGGAAAPALAHPTDAGRGTRMREDARVDEV